MDLKQIAAFIKMKRKALGMTQAQLAERLAVSEKAVSRWETGRGTPDISLLLPLAHELHVEVGELLNATMHEDANQAVAQLLAYHEAAKHHRYGRSYFRMIGCYGLSVLNMTRMWNLTILCAWGQCWQPLSQWCLRIVSMKFIMRRN